MFGRAKNLLKAGDPCILDATFLKKRYRDAAFRIAKESGVPLLIVECVCPENVVRERLTRRIKDITVSDGRWEIYPRQREDFEPIQPSEPSITIDTTKLVNEQVDIVLDKIDEISSFS
jgi:hypothetical protein